MDVENGRLNMIEFVWNKNKFFFCAFCLTDIKSKAKFLLHRQEECKMRAPHFSEIYRCGDISVFETDGEANYSYCGKLLFIVNLFLNATCLNKNVETLIFYMLTRNDINGCHLVGFFLKEKYAIEKNYITCIVIVPQYQNESFDKFLLDFSKL